MNQKPSLICLSAGLIIVITAFPLLAQESPKAHIQEAVGLNDKGVAACDAGNFDDAITLFNEAIRLRPDYALAYSNLGAALYHKRRFEEAITTLKKAIQLSSHHAE